ncbi:hypothetical protein BDR07DRAFT_1433413 [Suillus spraguei]|nr:hypothetical protein BDR07DRAFT_1433413 [Suillus spraguei]
MALSGTKVRRPWHSVYFGHGISALSSLALVFTLWTLGRQLLRVLPPTTTRMILSSPSTTEWFHEGSHLYQWPTQVVVGRMPVILWILKQFDILRTLDLEPQYF